MNEWRYTSIPICLIYVVLKDNSNYMKNFLWALKFLEYSCTFFYAAVVKFYNFNFIYLELCLFIHCSFSIALQSLNILRGIMQTVVVFVECELTLFLFSVVNTIFNILLSFPPSRIRMILDEVRNGREDKSSTRTKYCDPA
jgi:hypothetical protein